MLQMLLIVLSFMPSMYAMEDKEQSTNEFVLRSGDCVRVAHCYLRSDTKSQVFDLPIETRPIIDQNQLARIAEAACSCLSDLGGKRKYLNFKALESYCFDSTPSLQRIDTHNPWNAALPMPTVSYTIDNQDITKLPDVTDKLVSIKSHLDLGKHPLLATSYWAIGEKLFSNKPSIKIGDMVSAMELVVQKKEQKQKPKQSKKTTPTKKRKQIVTQTNSLGITKPRAQRTEDLTRYKVTDALWGQVSGHFQHCTKPSMVEEAKTFLAKVRYQLNTECQWKNVPALPFEKPEEILTGPAAYNRWHRLSHRLGDSQGEFKETLLADLQ